MRKRSTASMVALRNEKVDNAVLPYSVHCPLSTMAEHEVCENLRANNPYEVSVRRMDAVGSVGYLATRTSD